jgi:hypothetical protein
MALVVWKVQALEKGYIILGDLKVGVHHYSPDLDIGQLLFRDCVKILNLLVGLCSKEAIAYLVNDSDTLVDCVTSSIYPSDRS